MFKVSVILPIFNGEKYISKCLDSLLAQNFEDFEIIIVDDGSTDNTLSICQSYRKESYKVRLFTQENQGVSVARNFGLKNSRGEYVIFVDVDDFVAADYLSSLVKVAEETAADIVCCNYVCFKSSNDILKQNESTNRLIKLTQDEFLRGLFTLDISRKKEINVAGYMWNKLIRHQIIGTSFFDPTRHVEDESFWISLYPRIQKLYYLDRKLYFRFIRDNSLCHNTDFAFRVIDDRIKMLQEILDPTARKIVQTACYQSLLNLTKKILSLENVEIEDLKKI